MFYDNIQESVKFIKQKMDSKPKIAIILGSGLGDLVNYIENKEFIDYKDIPNFPVSTIKGHAGKLVLGKIGNTEIIAMQGRFHYYEGYTMKEVTYPMYVFKELGVEKIIVTNACGGINKNFKPGTLMLISDFINLFGTNPLIGSNDDRFGTRFPDMSEPFNNELRELAKKVAIEQSIDFQEGVYAGMTGPSFETAAEIRYLDTIGVDGVGMSTVPETIVANYLGLEVLGISCITNMATGIQNKKHNHNDVVKTAKIASENFCNWVKNIVIKL